MATCKYLVLQKHQDYGSAWRVLRPESLTDQILIKATRIRNIQERHHQQIDDPMELEFVGMINYSLMALIQLEDILDERVELTAAEVESAFDRHIAIVRDLLTRKNYDYGEVWRLMRVGSITDLILMKLHRIKQIEDNAGHTRVSEGLPANYQDIINYSIFALILLNVDVTTFLK